MLALPTITAPASVRRATAVASWGGVVLGGARGPAVVATPATSKRSLMATGTPASGPGSRPAAKAASTARACSRARSPRTVMNALIEDCVASAAVSARSGASSAVKSPARRPAANAVMLSGGDDVSIVRDDPPAVTGVAPHRCEGDLDPRGDPLGELGPHMPAGELALQRATPAHDRHVIEALDAEVREGQARRRHVHLHGEDLLAAHSLPVGGRVAVVGGEQLLERRPVTVCDRACPLLIQRLENGFVIHGSIPSSSSWGTVRRSGPASPTRTMSSV